MRIRSYTTYEPLTPCQPSYTSYGGYVAPSCSVSTGLLGMTNTCTGGVYKKIADVSTPNYIKRSKAGEIINNPLYLELETWKSNVPTLNSENYYLDSHGCKVGGRVLGPYAPELLLGDSRTCTRYLGKPTIDTGRLSDIAITEAYSRIDFSEAALLATLGELPETISGLISIFKRSIKIFRAIRKFDIKALLGEISPKELADRYMEYRYGIRPLLYDVKSILSAYNSTQKKFDRYTFRGKASASAQAGPTEFTYYANSVFAYKAYASVKREVTARAGCLTHLHALSKLNVWGLDQPIETLWELLPYSFVIDWFFNIGKTIASFTPEAGCEILASYVTMEDITSWSISGGHVTAVPGSGYTYATTTYSPEYSKVSRIKARTPNPSRPILPSFDVRLDSLKLLDLAIIIRNLLR